MTLRTFERVVWRTKPQSVRTDWYDLCMSKKGILDTLIHQDTKSKIFLPWYDTYLEFQMRWGWLAMMKAFKYSPDVFVNQFSASCHRGKMTREYCDAVLGYKFRYSLRVRNNCVPCVCKACEMQFFVSTFRGCMETTLQTFIVKIFFHDASKTDFHGQIVANRT